MGRRMETVMKIGRVLAVAVLFGIGAQLAAPVAADARSAKCYSRAVPGKPGTYVVTCTTLHP